MFGLDIRIAKLASTASDGDARLDFAHNTQGSFALEAVSKIPYSWSHPKSALFAAPNLAPCAASIGGTSLACPSGQVMVGLKPDGKPMCTPPPTPTPDAESICTVGPPKTCLFDPGQQIPGWGRESMRCPSATDQCSRNRYGGFPKSRLCCTDGRIFGGVASANEFCSSSGVGGSRCSITYTVLCCRR